MATVVAIAGGTSGWGRTIIEQIQREGGFQPIVLTRQELEEGSKIKNVQVDYDDIPGLAAILDRHAVKIVISVIGLYDDGCSAAQLNLIDAAIQSSTVQKFIPSEYSYNTDEKYAELDPGMKWFLDAAARLKQSRLQFTRVWFGGFMDYLGRPNVHTNIMMVHVSALDPVKGRALVAGDGSSLLSMTYSYDAATFIAKILDWDEWPEFSCCVGDDATHQTMIREVEQASGKTLQITYLSKEEIEQGRTDQIEAALADYDDSCCSRNDLIGFALINAQLTLRGGIYIPHEYRLSEEQTGFKPRSLREFLSEFHHSG